MNKHEREDLRLTVKELRKQYKDVTPESPRRARAAAGAVNGAIYRVLSKVARKSDSEIRDYLAAVDQEIENDKLVL